jgi:hypothetical protein
MENVFKPALSLVKMMKISGSFALILILVCIVTAVALFFVFYANSSGSKESKKEGLELIIDIENPSIKRGEKLVAKLILKNNGKEEVLIDFFSAQRFDLYLYKGKELLGRWSDEMMFAQVMGQIILKPGESLEDTLEWALSYFDKETGAEAFPAPGKYGIVGVMVGRPRLETEELPITIRA